MPPTAKAPKSVRRPAVPSKRRSPSRTRSEPAPGARGGEARPIRRIVVPHDFSKPAAEALETARFLAQRFGAEIALVHVVAPLVYPPDSAFVPLMESNLLQSATQHLERIASTFKPSGMVAEAKVLTGTPHLQIVRFAKDWEADLIVLATHGFSGLKHWVIGSTAERVVRHAHCPVFVVRAHPPTTAA